MIGGYQILDLRGIDLEVGTEAGNITDEYVLKQLLMFRDHIDKAYDFTKPLVNQLKPVLIRFRDEKVNEKTEGATFGELSVDGNYYTFKVTARISGYLMLTIQVAFEEITNEYGNKEWVIDTATILLKDESKTIEGDLELTGDLSVGDDVTVTGDASVGGDSTVTGNESIGGGLTVTGDASVGGDSTVTGDESVGGDLTVTGDAKLFENIVDLQDHNRFIEGNVTGSVTGLTYDYGKWSLSGTHLMIVVAGRIADETTIDNGSTIASLGLPQWILDKIIPIKSPIVSYREDIAVNDDYSLENLKTLLQKGFGALYILLRGGSVTFNQDASFRIQYDLLIDNAQPINP